jgi:hypothetical protein
MREPDRLVSDCCFQIGRIAMAIDSSHHLAITKSNGKRNEHLCGGLGYRLPSTGTRPQGAFEISALLSVLRGTCNLMIRS